MQAKRQTRDSEILGDYYDPKYGKERTALTLPTFAWRKLFDNWGEIAGSEEASKPPQIDNSSDAEDETPHAVPQSKGRNWTITHANTQDLIDQFRTRINDPHAYDNAQFEGGVPFLSNFIKRNQQRDADRNYLSGINLLYEEFKQNVRTGWRGSFSQATADQGSGGGGYGYEEALEKCESRRYKYEQLYIKDYNKRWSPE